MNDLVFELENLAYEMKVIISIFDMVEGELAEEMGDRNEAILYGLWMGMWSLNEKMQELKDKGFMIIASEKN